MSIRVPISIVIEMDDEQVKNYASEYGLTVDGVRIRAKDIVQDVRENVLHSVQGYFDDFADVTMKGRA